MLLTTKLVIKQNKDSRPWADLPQEILESIMGNLCFNDQIRFRAVCKAWRQIQGIKPNTKFPWLFMDIDKDRHFYGFPFQSYCLYDPSSRKSYIVENKVEHKCRRNKSGYVHFDCLAARSGWLLLGYSCCEVIFLYNAFTQEIVDVNLYRQWGSSKYTFRYCPNRREFKVYAVDRIKASAREHDSILISSWSTGERDWNGTQFRLTGIDCNEREKYTLECTKETLYCVFGNGTVGEFKNNKWTVLVDSKTIESRGFRGTYSSGNYNVGEYEGELFLVKGEYAHGIQKWHIFRLDCLNKTWIEEHCLDKRALFCSDRSLSPWPFAVVLSGTERRQDLADQIFCRCSYDSRIDNLFYHGCNKAPGITCHYNHQIQQRSNNAAGGCLWACLLPRKAIRDRWRCASRAFWIEPPTL